MEKTDVVTCFLMNNGEILILERDHVGTYQDLWAAVSGYIEKGERSRERAFREISEETGLKKSDVVLLKEGSTFAVEDKYIKKKWIVHPFLFQAKKRRIRLDREHKAYKWIKPRNLPKYDTVPELIKSYEMVK